MFLSPFRDISPPRTPPAALPQNTALTGLMLGVDTTFAQPYYSPLQSNETTISGEGQEKKPQVV
jgi:hypothetical protein